MTLVFISENNTPNYLALSSDISGGKIAGATLVGGTVLLTDTNAWKIIGGDSSLSDYVLPVTGGGGGATTFIQLSDVPASYSGQAGKLVAVNGGATALEFVASGGGGFTPSHYHIPLFFADSNTGYNTLGTVASLDYYLRTDNGNQDNLVIYNIDLPAGTYSWYLMHLTDSAAGIYHLLLDGSELATIDGYEAGNTITRSTVTGITVPAASPTAVQIKMSSKNVSSSAYFGFILDMWLIRTGA